METLLTIIFFSHIGGLCVYFLLVVGGVIYLWLNAPGWEWKREQRRQEREKRRGRKEDPTTANGPLL